MAQGILLLSIESAESLLFADYVENCTYTDIIVITIKKKEVSISQDTYN